MNNIRVVVVGVVFAGTATNGFNQYRIVDATGLSYITKAEAFAAQSARDLKPGMMVDLGVEEDGTVKTIGQPIPIPSFNPKGDV